MSLWRGRLLPRLVDKGLAGEEHAARRARAAAGLSGTVVEIGFGSGLNLPHYPLAVRRVLAVDPVVDGARSTGRRLAERSGRIAAFRAAREGGAPSPAATAGAGAARAVAAEVEFVGGDAQRIALPDGSADAVLTTWSLCTIPDPRAALAEAHRLLRPGGELRFVEHGLSPDADVAAWQRRLEPLQRLVFGGCRLRLPVDRLIAEAGFSIEALATGYMPGPRFSAWLFEGRARPVASAPRRRQ